MKRISLILALSAIGCILLSQAGCGHAAKDDNVPQAPQKQVAAANQAAPEDKPPEAPKPKPAPDKPDPAPDKPKPVPDKPKPVPNKPKPAPKVDPNTPGPKIEFDKLIHDLGSVDPGSNNVCEFPFKNVGDALLKIISVKPGCQCTQYTLEKKEYEPGESGTLKFKYHAALQAGPINRPIPVTTNDPVQPITTLTIKGRIVEQVGYEPKKLNLLLKSDDQTLPTITLTSLDGKPFAIKGFKSSVNAISAKFDPAVEATKFVLQIEVDKAQLQKVSNGIVEIALTHPAAKSVSVPFSALTRFKLNPTIIIFDAEPGKNILRDKVTILNNYQEAFEIESVKSKEGITKVVKQEKISNGYMFSLQITPPDPEGKQRFSDEISVQIKGGELLKIKCQGFYKRKTK
ncbi:MAG: DUF1573 domain-containing protein [Planctomycetes bacterium]|jgi:hypothetical protein|nr:DUF1573 domain-containing protein [Planctomycetota bacterium]